MRIASAHIVDFKPFADSGIGDLRVEFSEDVQIVIGPNGCGKSTFTTQLSPAPVTRSLYGKKGFRETVYEKDGTYYRSVTEYEKPSSPHMFFEGESEENLNVGRTTGGQQDLIVEHLGITPFIDDLIMNRYLFPRWGAARRKEFLMQHNPDQIGFVLKHIKDVASKIKACRNNLNRLNERKILLEQQMVDADTLVNLYAEKQKISSDLGDFQQHLMNIEIGLGTVGPTSFVDMSLIKTTTKMLRRARNSLVGLAHIERDDRRRQRVKEDTIANIATCQGRAVNYQQEIDRVLSDLSDMETRYREIAVDGELIQLDASIARLEFEKESLSISKPPFEFTKEDLEIRHKEAEVLLDRLELFNNLTVPLLPSKRRQHRERMLQTYLYKQSSWGMRLQDYKNQYEELSRRHRLKPSDIPDQPCAKNACPLYAHFMGEYENTEHKRQKLQVSIETGTRRIARVNMFVERLGHYLEESRPYTETINWLVERGRSDPAIHHVLRSIDILSVLSNSPYRIYRMLVDLYGHIERWIKLKEVIADLETAHILKNRQISLENSDTVKLVSDIEKTKEALEKLRTSLQTVSDDERQYQLLLNDINLFNDVKQTVFDLRDQHIQTMHLVANNHERDQLVQLRRDVEELRAQNFLRMSDIEKTVRAQSGLKERYDEEVMSQISLIEQELVELQQIEAALVVIPRQNMMGFINNVFDQANRLIDSVWTIPLKIKLLGEDDALDYQFQVTGDNDSVREMSECSEGQTEIISHAINLALRIVLQHFDYPIVLDEASRTMDEKHRQNFVMLLKKLLTEKVVSQIFFVSHHAVVHEAFSHSETMVIREDNVVLPAVYNQHVVIR